MLRTKILYLLTLFLTISLTIQAQKKRHSIKPKVAIVEEEVKSASELLYENMLASTAQILIIDSFVTDKNNFINNIPLNKKTGQIYNYNTFWNTSSQPSSYVYVNGFGNKAIFSEADSNGVHQLYTADKLGGKWSNKKSIDDFSEDIEDINHPFMLSDGVTLYFSAKSKDNLGGYDIYVTRFDTDSAKFYRPENIGLPYNSSSNDYFCIIDDYYALGWLVTDRRQPKDKVCIYTFVPPVSRTAYNTTDIGEQTLKDLADIKQIKDTWTNADERQNALSRLQKLIQHNKQQHTDAIRFIVNDHTIYTSINDFRSTTNKEDFIYLCQMKKTETQEKQRLDNLRKEYTNGDNSIKHQIAKEINEKEKRLEQLSASIKETEKHIRNTENTNIINLLK